jgi:hypothetical protein
VLVLKYNKYTYSKKRKDMPKYVCNGATLKCSMGLDTSTLIVTRPKVNNEKNPMANIMDYMPMTNIQPFGNCISLLNPVVAAATAKNLGVLEPKPCIPVVVAPWIPGKPEVMKEKQPSLMDYCINTCAYLGIITITDAGQSSIKSSAAGADMGAMMAQLAAEADAAMKDAEKAMKEGMDKDK